MLETCDDCHGPLGVGGPHECDPGEVELAKHMKLSEEERAADAEIIAAAKALDQAYVNWRSLGLAGLRMEEALTRRAAVELRKTTAVSGSCDRT